MSDITKHPEFEDYIEGAMGDGYFDGVDDGANAVTKVYEEVLGEEILRPFERDLYLKTEGQIALTRNDAEVCPACNGSGENTNPNGEDLALAIVKTAGAYWSRDPSKCRNCQGYCVIFKNGPRF